MAETTQVAMTNNKLFLHNINSRLSVNKCLSTLYIECRGADGLWKKRQITEIATPDTFRSNPSLVWEFYNHRRKVATNKVN